MNAELSPLGLTEATWLPLLFLHREGPVRQVELADYLGLDRSSVVRLIDNLSRQGLVERQDDPADRRAKLVVVTEAAADILRTAEASSARVRAAALAGIAAADIATAEAVLGRIIAQLPFSPSEGQDP
ncbi:MarR family winged helix-turn-helix transcriptional regulator [Solirhodobacter olei]|uniref:MarR family winged helix-turn-helix transcriptional regulator n=1 Tax=Solirhodobacter olei TaxID=2493082 RepID=UPI0019D4D306|nr:MarR family transcriptional regulator [Solirhodobacter olei]